MDKKYRLGVLGLGEGRSIISAALNSEYWELANVCDLNENLCQERMKEFGLKEYTTNYDDMLKDPSIDVIGIYTPDQLHGLHIRKAIEAGKDVICTKPVIPSLKEANELLECVKSTGRTVFVGQSSRFFEPMIQQRADYEKGQHGELVSVETHYNTDGRWFLKKGWSLKNGFSWMYGFMIHAVDLARWYMTEIEEVYGCGVITENTKEYGLNRHDTVKFLLKDKQGRFAVVGGSYATPCLDKEVEPTISCKIRGNKGISRAEYPRLRYNTHFAYEGCKSYGYDEKHDYYFRFEEETHHAGEYQNYIEYFAKCLNDGQRPKPDLNEAIVTLAVMEAMEKSLKTGNVVKVAEVLKEYAIEL